MLFTESVFAVDFSLEPNVLLRRCSTHTERLVPTGPNFGAWRMPQQVPFTPQLSIPIVERTARAPLPVRRPWPSHRRRKEAAEFLLDCWPSAWRERVRTFGDAHWPLLGFLFQGGEAARELLDSSPALAYLTALEAPQELPSVVIQKRKQLAARFGFPASQHAVRALSKIPAPELSVSLLTKLRASLQSPSADVLLSHLPAINSPVLEIATSETWRNRIAAPGLREIALLPTGTRTLADRLEAIARQSRRENLPLPEARTLADLNRAYLRAFAAPVEAPLPPVPNVAPRATRWTAASPFPAPPIAASQGIEALVSPQDLALEGTLMRHCIGSNSYYEEEIRAGRLYAYRIFSPQRLTFTIRRQGGTWTLQEVNGHRNSAASAESMEILEAWLGGGQAPPLAARRERPRGVRPNAAQLEFDFG